MKNVYVLRNKKISAYLDPFFRVEDKKQIEVDLSRFCILEKAKAQELHYDECELYYLGQYDDEKGVCLFLDDKEFIVDLNQYFVEK